MSQKVSLKTATQSLKVLGVAELADDPHGRTATQMANLADRAFREPPWNDHLAVSRLLVGLGVDLMRRNAAAVVAADTGTDSVVSYALGYELATSTQDPRDLTGSKKSLPCVQAVLAAPRLTQKAKSSGARPQDPSGLSSTISRHLKVSGTKKAVGSLGLRRPECLKLTYLRIPRSFGH